MSRMKVYTIGVVSALAYASAAMAQGGDASAATQAADPVKPFTVGVLGGATIPTGNLRDVSNTGWNAGAFVTVGLDMPVAFRLEGMYNRLGSKDISETIGANTVTVNTRPSFTSGTLNAVWNVPMGGGIQPYLIGGGGVYHLSYDQSCSSSTAGACTGFTTTASATRFGVNVGGGIAMRLMGVSAFVEARWHDVFTKGNSSQMVPISVGLKL